MLLYARVGASRRCRRKKKEENEKKKEGGGGGKNESSENIKKKKEKHMKYVHEGGPKTHRPTPKHHTEHLDSYRYCGDKAHIVRIYSHNTE